MAYGAFNYNPYYGVQYPGYQQPMIQSQTPQQVSGMIWVQGEAGAKAYNLRPGESAFLMDSEAPMAYLKRTDANGMPSMDYFKVEKITPEAAAAPVASADYASAADLAKLREELSKLRKTVKSLRDSMEVQTDE